MEIVLAMEDFKGTYSPIRCRIVPKLMLTAVGKKYCPIKSATVLAAVYDVFIIVGHSCSP